MKRFGLSFLISLIINLLGLGYEYLSWRTQHYLPLALQFPGGECLGQYGFGLYAFHIYGMTPDQVSSHSVAFRPLLFLLGVLALAALIFLILTMIAKIKGK